jgi:HrpA-like RNA helicase
LRRVDETVINYDLIEDILDEVLLKNSSVFTPLLDGIQDLQDQSSTGAVLIFLPGLEEIRTLMERLTGNKIYGDAMHFQILPLHSTLSSVEQKRPFLQTPPGCRKIVISTNVAETSVTIPDVVYVIDSGRVREITRNRKSNSRKLVTTWCSKASAKQRSGRAGRVQPGICLKLYSSRTENGIMREATEPELLRIPLEEVCLTILAGGFGKNCSDFLSQTPQPPSNEAVRSAIKVLEDIGAITTSDSSNNETLTSLGSHLAKLPVDARVGKMLIFGALFKCTDSVLTIAAFLSSSKSPFLSKLGDHFDVAPQRSQFLHPFSDFVTYVNLWSAFQLAVKKGKEKDFCRQNLLSYPALRDIQHARQHYLELLFGLGFLDFTGIHDGIDERNFDEKFKRSQCNRNTNFEFLVNAVVYAGLFPNVAYVNKATAHGDFTVLQKTERLHVQSSVISKLKGTVPSSWITYFEKFGTERRVCISRVAFLPTICLLLFSPSMQVLHTERKVIVDGWIEITASAKTGVVLQEFQNRFADFLSAQFDSLPASNQQALKSKKIDKIIDLLVVLLSRG